MRVFCRALICCVLFHLACSEKKDIVTPQNLLSAWARGIQVLNYTEYAAREAYPMSPQVFADSYRDYYLDGMKVMDVSESDGAVVYHDTEGNTYVKKSITFHCREYARKTRKKNFLIRGEAELYRFLSGSRKNDGWLLANRTLIRMER